MSALARWRTGCNWSFLVVTQCNSPLIDQSLTVSRSHWVSLDVTRGEKKSDNRMYNQLTKGMTAMLSDGELKTAIKNG